jgi:hypothetical protein
MALVSGRECESGVASKRVESYETEPMGRVSVWFGQADSVKMQVRHVITTNDCFGRKVRLTDERVAHILERTKIAACAKR